MDLNLDRIVEAAVVLFSLLYVGLIAFNHRSGWWYGIVASLLSVWLFIEVNLLAESLLYAFYVVMGLYGYFHWKYGANSRDELSISTRPIGFHLVAIVVSITLTVAVAQILKIIGSSQIYADAATTVLSFLATWMVAQRILENWIYWIVIDAFSVWLYSTRGLLVYAILMGVYSIIAIFGFYIWLKTYRQQQAFEPPSA